MACAGRVLRYKKGGKTRKGGTKNQEQADDEEAPTHTEDPVEFLHSILSQLFSVACNARPNPKKVRNMVSSEFTFILRSQPAHLPSRASRLVCPGGCGCGLRDARTGGIIDVPSQLKGARCFREAPIGSVCLGPTSESLTFLLQAAVLPTGLPFNVLRDSFPPTPHRCFSSERWYRRQFPSYRGAVDHRARHVWNPCVVGSDVAMLVHQGFGGGRPILPLDF